jgi:signal transduction histidine kinase
MAPVRSGPTVFGFLAATARDRNSFDRDELRRLEVLANMTGLAIGNAENLRREQQHAERTAALERTKSELLNLVSHELRGPLTVIRGYLSMLDEGAFGDLPDEYRRQVLPILEAKLTAMDLIVEQTLEASRLEDSRLLLKMGPADLREILEDAGRTMASLAAERHQLKIEVPEAPVPVNVDPDRIGTILTNLIDNAIKYSPAGGPVECRLEVVAGSAAVTVSDHGLGIAEEDLPALFTRFGRLVTPENSHINGTGLGLYLSQELARRHGGIIEVESAPGRGSNFKLTLPLAAQSAAADEAIRQPRGA